MNFETKPNGNHAIYCDGCRDAANLLIRNRYKEENREIIRAKNRLKYSLNKDDPNYIAEAKIVKQQFYEKNKEKIRQANVKRREEVRDNTAPYADNHGLSWSEEEIEFLHEHSEDMTAEDIAISLGRTALSVYRKVCRENIRLGEKQHHGKYGIISERTREEGRGEREPFNPEEDEEESNCEL